MKKTFSVYLEKDFLSQLQIYFSFSFDFYFFVSYKSFYTSAIISFNIETLNFGANLPLYISLIKFEVATALRIC